MTTAQLIALTASLAIVFAAGWIAGMQHERSRQEPEPTDSQYEADQDRRSL